MNDIEIIKEKVEFNHNVFYISNDKDKYLKLNNKGYIISCGIIVIKRNDKKFFKTKILDGDTLCGKSILDIYPKLFKYGLDNEHNKKVINYYQELKDSYVKPEFKPLTQEQIDDIHARGKITPSEVVKEWEDMDLCAPGDAIGSASWRCKKFNNCHDCLVDYANKQDEYNPFCSNLVKDEISNDEEEKGNAIDYLTEVRERERQKVLHFINNRKK